VTPSEVPVFVLCGGLGTRLKEETEFRPKPMVPIGGEPILAHILRGYRRYGFERFVLCLGFRAEVIEEHFDGDGAITLVRTGDAAMTGARVARAAAVGRVEGARAGLEALDAIEDEAAARFQPAWAARAHLLAEAGRASEAVAAYERAISLTTDNRARRYLERQRARLLGEGRG
jgi:tetratricopeptide (TPR) repeat protein